MRLIIAGLVIFAIASPAIGGARKVENGIEFTYVDPYAFSVHLAGTFNNWNITATPMEKDEQGVWRVVIPLAPGRYEYKFVVNGSQWVADPDNPKVVGEYGNSEIFIDQDGNPVIKGVARIISNTPANARVMINGWFRGTYDTRKDALGDVRWRLSRPSHEMYVSFNPTIDSNVRGSVTIRLDSGQGDIREISAELYSGHLSFESTRFDLLAYHNEEVISIDDPMEIVGHQDLPGTPWDDELDFGRGTQGVVVNVRLAGTRLQALYSNTYDADIYNSFLRYDNTGTDILTIRAKRKLLGLKIGATYLSRRNGWWVGFEGENQEDRYIQEYRRESGDDASYWFEMGTSETFLGADITAELRGLKLFGEVGRTGYEAGWDAGNRVRKEGDQLVDGKIDVPVGDEDGWRLKFGISKGKDENYLKLSFERQRFKGMDEEEIFVASHGCPYCGDSINVYTKVNGIDEFTIYEYGPLPRRENDIVEARIMKKLGGFDLGLEFDMVNTSWDYPDTSRKDFDNTWLRIVPSLRTELLGDRLGLGVTYEMTRDNFARRMPGRYDRGELTFRGELKLTDKWLLYANMRRVSYRWEGGKHSFFNPHLALVWSPVKRIEIRIGYGLNPLYYRDTPVEGREIGRERWMSTYLWRDPSLIWIDAERALENLKIVSVMGVVAF